MEKQHIKELIVRGIILFVGLTIAHLGVTLFLLDKSYLKIGTIICAFLVGPVAGFFLPRNERIIEKIISCIH